MSSVNQDKSTEFEAAFCGLFQVSPSKRMESHLEANTGSLQCRGVDSKSHMCVIDYRSKCQQRMVPWTCPTVCDTCLDPVASLVTLPIPLVR